ncbi:unnamed protein product [Natator depressus]
MFLVAFFPPNLFIYALPIHGLTKSRDLLVNLLLALAKTAICKTRERRLADGVSCDCGTIFRSSVGSRIRAEFLWAASTDSLDAFEEQWALSEALCLVSPSGFLCFDPLIGGESKGPQPLLLRTPPP